MVRLYVARAMSNRVKSDVVKEAKEDKKFLEQAGFEVLCPVVKEEVEPSKHILMASRAQMEAFWPEDKALIRQAHVVLDMSPLANSEGVKHELGYARYYLYRPIIRIFPAGKLPPASSVAFFEDDFICDSLIEAVEYILRVHGTWLKRMKWRIGLYNRCFLKMVLYWFQSWK